MFIAIKTDDGRIKGKNSFYCRSLHVSRQAFNKYLKTKATPWKYQPLADAMVAICREDECNDTYGRIRMYQALQLKQPEGVDIPGERTVYRVMEEIGLTHKPKRKPNGITKADKEARKSDDLIKRVILSGQSCPDGKTLQPCARLCGTDRKRDRVGSILRHRHDFTFSCTESGKSLWGGDRPTGNRGREE